MVTEVFTVTGMHCSSCTMLIDETLEDLDGVTSSETDLRRGETWVQFDPDRVPVAQIITSIQEAGYRAELRHG